MENRVHSEYKVSDRSYVAILKKDIHAIAVRAGLSLKRLAETDIIVSELASNLVKYADHGLILAKEIYRAGANGIEIIGIDHGPGMTDVTRMLMDGMSTKNTLGHGLGAIKRLADTFQIYSQKEWGTISLIRIFNEKPPNVRQRPVFQTSDIVLPKAGETECGDGFFCKKQDGYVKLFLGDGLGHGRDAAIAVKTAGDAFLICEENEPVEIIRYINSSVKKTRGLVGTVAVFDMTELKWRMCGVGNISSKFFGPSSKTHISYNGIIGSNLPNTLNSLEIAYERDQHLIMCSDGIKSRWEFSNPAVFRYDLSVVASAILKDYNRNTDDVSVVVCKINL